MTTPLQTKRGNHPTTLRWPPELHDQLRAAAERHDRTPLAAEIRVAIREHLEREHRRGRTATA